MLSSIINKWTLAKSVALVLLNIANIPRDVFINAIPDRHRGNPKYPSQVMKVGVKLLDSTHPDVDREHGPPLLRALCGLMEEFAGLRSPNTGIVAA